MPHCWKSHVAAHLYFQNIQASDEGWYQCVVANSVGNVSENAFIKVQGKYSLLTLNIVTKVVCFSHLLKVQEASMANSVDPDQTAPIGAVCSGSMLFASILNLSVMLGNYFQQTTSADDIFRCIFFLAL